MLFSKSLLCAATLATSVSGAALAQRSPADGYPSKPVSVVIPFVAGGSNDSEARLYTDKLFASLGQPFVLDFRPGAASSIGVSYVIKSAPDGYTLMITNASISVVPHYYPAINDTVAKTLVPITEFSNRATAVIISPAALPNVNSLQDLLAYAKANPGTLNCNTAGAGGAAHTLCAALAGAMNIKITPVHYKGLAQGQIDLIAGRVQVSGGSLLGAMPHIKTGKLRAIAILRPERASFLPDLKTSHEQGFPVDYPSWLGAFAPPDTPPAIINKLNAEFVKAVRSPDVVKQLTALGSDPVASTPETFRRKFSNELVYWKKVIQDNDIKIDE